MTTNPKHLKNSNSITKMLIKHIYSSTNLERSSSKATKIRRFPFLWEWRRQSAKWSSRNTEGRANAQPASHTVTCFDRLSNHRGNRIRVQLTQSTRMWDGRPEGAMSWGQKGDKAARGCDFRLRCFFYGPSPGEKTTARWRCSDATASPPEVEVQRARSLLQDDGAVLTRLILNVNHSRGAREGNVEAPMSYPAIVYQPVS